VQQFPAQRVADLNLYKMLIEICVSCIFTQQTKSASIGGTCTTPQLAMRNSSYLVSRLLMKNLGGILKKWSKLCCIRSETSFSNKIMAQWILPTVCITRWDMFSLLHSYVMTNCKHKPTLHSQLTYQSCTPGLYRWINRWAQQNNKPTWTAMHVIM
jgi:hypothetical protein